MDKKTIAYILIGGGAAIFLYMMLNKKKTGDTAGTSTGLGSILSDKSTLEGGTRTPTIEEAKAFQMQRLIALGFTPIN